MTHSYKVTGMTCSSCEAKVKSGLLKLPDVLSADVSLKEGKATIGMNKHIRLSSLQEAISPEKKYIITEDVTDSSNAISMEEKQSWIATYKPLLLIFGYITAISFIAAFSNGVINWSAWMNNFMAGFFLTFSFFKLIDLRGFADGYSTYDLIAGKWKLYGFIYPFIELFFGVSLLLNVNTPVLYSLIFIAMGFSTLGVIKSMMKKTIHRMRLSWHYF